MPSVYLWYSDLEKMELTFVGWMDGGYAARLGGFTFRL